MNKTLKTALAVLPFLLTVACTDPAKAPAEAAIQAADTAISTLGADVQKYAPDQVKAVKDAFAKAKLAALKDDWNGALAAAKGVPEAAQAAVAAASAKKAELEKAAAEAAAKAAELKASWEKAAAELPAKIDELKKQVAALAKTKNLPKGMTKAAVAQGQEAVASLETAFSKASETAKTDVQAAGAAAKELMAKAAETAASLTKK